MATDLQIAYLAGFFDGEGCIRVMCNRAPIKIGQNPVYRLVMIVNQRYDHREPLLLLQSIFGGWIGRVKVRKGCKPMASWVLAGKPAAEAIRQMFPYFMVKKAQALAGLAFQSWVEIARTGRKSGQRLSEFELEIAEGFTKLFYILNGNKPLTEEVEPISVDEGVMARIPK